MRLTVLVAVSALALAVPLMAGDLPNYDALAEAPARPVEAAQVRLAAATTNQAFRIQWEHRLGVPAFLWPTASATAVAAAKIGVEETTDRAARRHLTTYAALYGLTSADVGDTYVASTHDTGRGAIVVKMRQKIGDVQVFRDEISIIMSRDRELVAIAGYLTPLPQATRIASNAAGAFTFSAAQAIAVAYADMFRRDQPHAVQRRGGAGGGFDVYEPEPDAGVQPIRVKPVYFHLPDHFEPAYYVELEADDAAYSYVISATDGHLFFRNNLIADVSPQYSYRVWARADAAHIPLPGPQGTGGLPNPSGTNDGFQPSFIAPNLITLGNGPISTGDPWLAQNATESVGNNVDAYVDLNSPDGLTTGDFRATTNGIATFDRIYDVTAAPDATKSQQMAAITQLFYDINFLHDWFYDAGFNEAAGNAQTDNYGRGGVAGDNMRAEAHDFGGRNNANMFTPSDGERPRLQLYIFDGIGDRTIHIDSPVSAAKDYASGTAAFGSQSFQVSGDIVATSPADGCSAITTDLTAKIAFLDRGTCNFSAKVRAAQEAGAVGVIVGNVADSPLRDSLTNMACSATPCSSIEAGLPPALLVAFADAETIRGSLRSGLHGTIRRDAFVDRDGAIDNQVIAHEWTHYLSNRLIGDGNGLANNQSRGMGEGWSDFNSLLLTVRPEDVKVASNATFNGAYAVGVYVSGGGANGPVPNSAFYFGIRRVPYSTDMTRDPLTLKHVGNGAPINGSPTRFGADGANNSEVHGTGEVWTTMLWECYASLLRDTLGDKPRFTFDQAQQRMKEYLVASLRATPINPTFLEARDALLAVAYALDKTDYAEFWQAFAKRGAGVNAVAPERFSTANLGGVEDFSLGGAMTISSISIDDSVDSCQTNGLLDSGETGALRITLRNTGTNRLEATHLAVSSADSHLKFANGGAADVAATNPGESVTVKINASLTTTVGIVQPDINIVVTDQGMAASGGLQAVYLARLNASEDPEQSATDDVESRATSWATNGAGWPVGWSRIEVTPRDHRWFASEPDFVTDQYLISPPMVVAPSGTFSFTFRHRYAFDYVSGTITSFVDGGVVEISTDGGKTWTDIGLNAVPGYGLAEIATRNGSPIEGRRAFEGTSPGFRFDLPSLSPFVTSTIDLGTDYQGKSVRVRFRLATGTGHSGAPRLGWEIDDLAFSNIVTLPFYGITANRGMCGMSPSTTSLRSSVSSARLGSPVTLTASVASNASAFGTVDFYDNDSIIGSVRVDSGQAVLTTTTLAPGAHTLSAAFAGSTNFSASRSSAISVLIQNSRRRAAGR
jgi:hypothetical protein